VKSSNVAQQSIQLFANITQHYRGYMLYASYESTTNHNFIKFLGTSTIQIQKLLTHLGIVISNFVLAF
jgi:hypothetical protein